MADKMTTSDSKSRLLLVSAIFAASVIFGAASSLSFNLILIAAAGACSSWLIYTQNFILGIIPVIPAYLIGYFVTGSFLTATLTVIFLPMGIMFAYVSLKKISRSTAAAASGAIAAIVIIAAVCIKTYVSQGGIGIAEIRNCFSELFDALGTMLQKSTVITVAGNETSFITAENVDKYINTFIGITPGCIVLITTLTAYVSGFLYRLLLKLTHKELPDATLWKLAPSPVTSVFFVVSVVVSVLVPTENIVWFAAVNFMLILVSGLIISGLNSITEIKIIDNIPRIPIFRIIISFLAIMFGGIGALLIYALLCGVTDSILGIFRKNDKSA